MLKEKASMGSVELLNVGENRASTRVGSFQRLDFVDQGSFARVYRGIHLDLGNVVAIKSVDRRKLSRKLKESLQIEIKILESLRHPHIVGLFDCVEDATSIHIVTEFCELGDLSKLIKNRNSSQIHSCLLSLLKLYPNPKVGGLNEVLVRHFLKQMASALEFIRSKNLVHRDIKPQNILLLPSAQWYSQYGEVVPMAVMDKSFVSTAGVATFPMLKIADFGFARVLPKSSLAETLCGSPLYMAPEILRFEKYDAKTDLWSVGVVLYEMMVGHPPFRASNHVELARKIERNNDRIRFPSDLDMSKDMEDMISLLLKKSPLERISFEDFFKHAVLTDNIDGLLEEDRKQEIIIDKAILHSNYAESCAVHIAAGPGKFGGTVGDGYDRVSSGDRIKRIERNHALQDALLDSEYVVVEKKAVEVNEIADVLEATSTEVERSTRKSGHTRRYTYSEDICRQSSSNYWKTIGQETLYSGGRGGSTAVTAKPFERFYSSSAGSAATAISKAINMASYRLRSLGISPPSGRETGWTVGGGREEDGFTRNNTTLSNHLIRKCKGRLESDGGGIDSDEEVVRNVEDMAWRSDLVYEFAEEKLVEFDGRHSCGSYGTEEESSFGSESDCTMNWTIRVGEEAIVLYVKTLSILVRLIDTAGKWWKGRMNKRRGENEKKNRETCTIASTMMMNTTSMTGDMLKEGESGHRMNSVVQWARGRFNGCLEKLEKIGDQLGEAQRQYRGLTEERELTSTINPERWTENITLTCGIRVEKLLYERAIEMSRGTALNELMNVDLERCEISYIRAISLLEAVVDVDEESSSEIDPEDEKMVQHMIGLMKQRLSVVKQNIQVRRANE